MGASLLWHFTPGLPAFGGQRRLSVPVLDVGTVCALACEAQSSSGSPLPLSTV